MRNLRIHAWKAVAAAATLGVAVPGAAATVIFSGTRQNVTRPPIPGTGRCAPTYFRTIVIEPGNLSSTGTSNFGSFMASMNHCETAAAVPIDILDGRLQLDFDAGDALMGAYTGRITSGPTAGLFRVEHAFTITGGTGRFAGASGTIAGLGTLRPGLVGGAPAGTYSGTLEGVLTLPAVPEPSTWMSLVAGFGIIGSALRRRRPRVASRLPNIS